MQAVTGAGRIIAGRYQLLDLLGQGAMGTVWRAHDPVLVREVAIKEVRLPALMSETERLVVRQRTLREARVAGKLSHPGVVTVYDVVEADGNPWIVMELVPARSLERVLKEDGPLPPGRVAEIGVMLLEALASAHAAGIVHRDVKPANVLVTADGRAVLSDFGIATLEGEMGLTQAGMVMGTPGFCAPERIRGEPASPASDLWSLGATLYAAAEGHSPYQSQGSPMAVLASIVHSEPPLARSAGALGPVISALMSKEPARRPDAATAARQLTEAARRGAPQPPTPSMPVSGTQPTAFGSPSAGWPASAQAGRRAATGPQAAVMPQRVTPAGAPACQTGPQHTFSRPHVPAGRRATGGLTAGPAQSRAAPTAQRQTAAGDVPWPWPPPDPSPPVARPTVSRTPSDVNGGESLRLGAASPSPSEEAGRNWTPLAGSATREAPRVPMVSQRARRPWLTMALAAAAIVCAGMLVGALASHGTRARRHGAAPAEPGQSAGAAAVTDLPSGYRWYSSPGAGPAPFSVALPRGWRVSPHGAADVARDPVTGTAVKFAALPASTSVRGRISLLAQRASHDLGYRRVAVLPLRGFSGLTLVFRFQRRGVGLMEGADVVARLGPLGARATEEFLLTTPAGNATAARAALAEMLRSFQSQS